MLTKNYMSEFDDQWDITAPLFQWHVRTTVKVYNGRHTAYEIVTGLKPRMPTDAMLSTPSVIKKIDQNTYVDDLVEN